VLTKFINKKISVRELVLQDTLVFLVEAYLKLVLGDSSKIDYYEVDFYNVYMKLCRISMEVKMTLEQEIIELVRLSTAESVRNIGFKSLN